MSSQLISSMDFESSKPAYMEPVEFSYMDSGLEAYLQYPQSPSFGVGIGLPATSSPIAFNSLNLSGSAGAYTYSSMGPSSPARPYTPPDGASISPPHPHLRPQRCRTCLGPLVGSRKPWQRSLVTCPQCCIPPAPTTRLSPVLIDSTPSLLPLRPGQPSGTSDEPAEPMTPTMRMRTSNPPPPLAAPIPAVRLSASSALSLSNDDEMSSAMDMPALRRPYHLPIRSPARFPYSSVLLATLGTSRPSRISLSCVSSLLRPRFTGFETSTRH
ncbi:hypothetical protein CC2G_000517 [Coprinopsis cinerea AmutBmut pab1-1]|nr:hypothetical protein CC2G_000517 [Coprinopsis cinerea AmutBmut pab1-1]